MLFYNEHDQICLKNGEEVSVLAEYDVVNVAGTYYSYVNGYFYRAIDCGDGEFQTDYDKRIHPRHMNILEMDEAFAPPTYKDELLDDVFRYEDGLDVEAYSLMYGIAKKIEQARFKSKDTVFISIKNYELNLLKEEGLRYVLQLLHKEYKVELSVEEDETNISLFWS